MRYPLVDGQGNFGSVDGDSPAAMRYTEARLSKLAEEMLRDIDKDTVDFQLNFDDTLKEPTVLPTRVPNLLVNGGSGIAVGMATNMPTHNLSEVLDGCIAYIDAKGDIEVEGLMQYIKAPNFPTGATIYGYAGVKDAFETGRGRIILRGKAEIDVYKRQVYNSCDSTLCESESYAQPWRARICLSDRLAGLSSGRKGCWHRIWEEAVGGSSRR